MVTNTNIRMDTCSSQANNSKARLRAIGFIYNWQYAFITVMSVPVELIIILMIVIKTITESYFSLWIAISFYCAWQSVCVIVIEFIERCRNNFIKTMSISTALINTLLTVTDLAL